MQDTAILAGYFAAHAAWSVADGEALVPILAFSKFAGAREMTRLEGDDVARALKTAHDWMQQNPDDVRCAVLIYDGYVTASSGAKTDALIIQAQQYGEKAGSFAMTIPYRSASDAAGFQIHRPTVESLDVADLSIESLSKDFFRGVNEHKKAAPVWAKHFNPEA
jgi:hypothetical protein